MLDMEGIYQMVHNQTTIKRAIDYVREGRILFIDRQFGSEGSYTARVRGHYGVYETWYEETNQGEIRGGCTCMAHARTNAPCKHVVALMIQNVMEMEHERQEKQWRQEQEKRRQEEEKRRKAEEKRLNEAFVDQMVNLSDRVRTYAARPAGRRVRLYPVIERRGMEIAALEFRVGWEGARAYIVRNPWDFAQRVLDGQHHAYGKGLAFAHDREMFDERDIPLIDLVLLLAEQRVRQNVPAFALKGSLLDQAMRVLLGREVELKKDGEDPVRVPVRTGEITPAVSLETSDGGAKLGLSGAYEFLPTGVVCAYGADFRRVEALLRAAAERPNGLPLEEKQIEPICAQVIAPSRAQVIQGRKTVLRHTPMEMTARFYLDADEKDALLCRPEWHYGAERVRPGEDTPHIRRDAFRENQALTRVRALFPEQRTEGEYAFDGDADGRYALLTERLRELDAVGEVMVSDRLARMNVKAPRAITFGMQRQGAKLLVHADLGGLTQADLDAAYAAYRQKRKYVRLKDGTFLSEEALDQAAQLEKVLESAGLSVEDAQHGAAGQGGRSPEAD